MWIVTNNGRVETTFGNGPGTNQQWEITVPWNHCVVPLESPNMMDHHGALLLARRLGRNRDPQVIIGNYLHAPNLDDFGVPPF